MNVFFPKESKVLKSAAPNPLITSDSNSKDKTKNERSLFNPLSFFFFYNDKSYSTNIKQGPPPSKNQSWDRSRFSIFSLEKFFIVIWCNYY